MYKSSIGRKFTATLAMQFAEVVIHNHDRAGNYRHDETRKS
jgi:hypothetical protein